MTKRFTWLGIVSSLAVVLSVMLSGLATGAKAAAPSRAHTAAQKVAATPKVAARCKTHNKASGTVKWSDWQFPDTFSGYTGGNLAVSALNTNLIFDGLTTYNDKVKLVPDVLTTIPTVKNKGIQNGGKTSSCTSRRASSGRMAPRLRQKTSTSPLRSTVTS
jgi:hypothetical protein